MKASYPIKNINLKLLQAFVLVAEHGKFRYAADETQRSQSAISSQIKQLELQLGLTLFHRTTRRVWLTSEGEQLLLSATKALEEVGTGLRKIFEAAERRRSSVSFACLPTFAATQLPRILSTFERDYPEFRVNVREFTTADLFDCIRQGEVDFALGTEDRHTEFHFDPILEDAVVALATQKFVGAEQETITLRQLSALPLLLPSASCSIGDTIQEALKAHCFSINAKHQCIQVQTIVSMAEVGLGVAILPRWALPTSLKGAVRILPIKEPEIAATISVVRLPGQILSQPAIRLIHSIKRQMSSSSGGTEHIRNAPSMAPASLEGEMDTEPMSLIETH